LKKQAFKEIRIGDKRTFSKVITEDDVKTFAAITGDSAPIHLDDRFARRTIFRSRITHGMFVAGLISAALSRFPGIIIYLSQSLRFLKPVRMEDRIEAVAEVLEKIDERSELRLKTVCINERNEIVVEGEARVMVMET
jgi:3-hydroxybutyryl-CoA dehydratase